MASQIRTLYAGAEQITSLAASTPLTPPANASWAILKPRAAVYVSLDGTPAVSGDMLLEAGVPLEITTVLADVRLLQVSAGAIVDVWYFG